MQCKWFVALLFRYKNQKSWKQKLQRIERMQFPRVVFITISHMEVSSPKHLPSCLLLLCRSQSDFDFIRDKNSTPKRDFKGRNSPLIRSPTFSPSINWDAELFIKVLRTCCRRLGISQLPNTTTHTRWRRIELKRAALIKDSIDDDGENKFMHSSLINY